MAGMTRGRRLLLATVCATAVATIYVAQPVLARIGEELGLSEGELGWIVAASQVGYLLGLVLLVPLGDMLDRRGLIVGQLLLAAGGVLVAAAAPGLWTLLAGLAAAGLFAVVVQTAVALAADLSAPGERGRTLGAVTSGIIIGILGARVVAGGLAGLWGWRSVYVALAVLLVVLALAARRSLPSDRRPGGAEALPAGASGRVSESGTPRRGAFDRAAYGQVMVALAGLFRERLFVSRGLLAFFVFASFGTLWSGLSLPLAAEPWRLSAAEIGLFGIAGLAGALGAGRAGRWADAGRTDLVTGGAFVLLAVSWAATGQAGRSLWLVVLGVVLLDFAVQLVHVSSQTLLTAAHPNRTSSVIGGYMLFYSCGSALGAAATTAAYAAVGWGGSAALGAAFAVCGLIVWAVGPRTGRPRPAEPAAEGTAPADVREG